MPKVVINTCYGGFSISEKAVYKIAELKGIKLYPEDGQNGFKTYWTVEKKPDGIVEDDKWHLASLEERQKSNEIYDANTMSMRPENRTCKYLIKAVEILGNEANGHCAELKVVDIPDDVDWYIEEYDGREWIAENHRTWN